MTVKEILERLDALGDEKTRAINKRQGIGDNQSGVKLGDLRKLAKEIKTDHRLALELWQSGHFEARMLALLIIELKELSADEVDHLVRSVNYARVADWVNAYVVKPHPDNESLRQKWMEDTHPMAARAGWYLTSLRVAKDPKILDIPSLLDRIEEEMGQADPLVQWTMNFSLAEIGIHHPAHRQRALAIGESLGIYRDFPVSKGCTSPFAPIWINEMVSRQK